MEDKLILKFLIIINKITPVVDYNYWLKSYDTISLKQPNIE